MEGETQERATAMAGVGPRQAAKRAFVAVLLRVAQFYKLVLGITRDSPDDELTGAYRKVARRAHPDKGGDKEVTILGSALK